MIPVSKTAYYCCGVRMLDAESANPVCNDTFAKVFMNEEGLRVFEEFRNETRPNASNVTRHRIIDDIIRNELTHSPDLAIVIVGAGFDSRAFRLNGGNWTELDEPAVIAYKNERLSAAECPNPLRRVPVSFATESLETRLPEINTPVLIVVEGVLMYLDEDATRRLLQVLNKVYPSHVLVCDLMSRRFLEKYGKRMIDKIKRLGASFAFVVDNPTALYERYGYTLTDRVSTVTKSVEYGMVKIPKLILRFFLRTLSTGYCVYRFEKSKPHDR